VALKQLGSERLTISTTKVPITVAELHPTAGPHNVLMAIMSHEKGGKIFHNSVTDPTGGGSEGSIPQTKADKWEIWGMVDLDGWNGIVRTGEADATVHVSLYGSD
jgi:hypothetical protein